MFLPFFIFIPLFLQSATFIFYIAADNSLYDESLSDINEIETSLDCDYIILHDRYNLLPEVIINKDDNIKKETLSFSINSGDPSVFSLLGNIIKDNDLKGPYYLILWDHGTSWLKNNNKGWGYDGKEDDWIDLYNDELYMAMQNITDSIGYLEAVFFDACLMQTVEVIWEIKDFTHFIVGSQDLVPLDGFPYKKWLSNINDDDNVSDVVNYLIGVYVDNYSDDVSLSVVYTGYANKYKDSFNSILKNMIETHKIYDNIRTPFSYNLTVNYDDNIDITDILPVIVYNKNSANIERKGLSAWMPLSKDRFNDYIRIYKNLKWARNTLWDEYIGRSVYNWNDYFIPLFPDSIFYRDNQIVFTKGYSIYGIKGYNLYSLDVIKKETANIEYNNGFYLSDNTWFAKDGSLRVNVDNYLCVNIWGNPNLIIKEIQNTDTVIIDSIYYNLQDTLHFIFEGNKQLLFINNDYNKNYVYMQLFNVIGNSIYKDFIKDTSRTFSAFPYSDMIWYVNVEDSMENKSLSVYKEIYTNSISVNIYPQPAKEYVYFDVGDNNVAIDIYTISGKYINTLKGRGKIRWDFKNRYGFEVSRGVYSVNIIFDEKMIKAKVVKK